MVFEILFLATSAYDIFLGGKVKLATVVEGGSKAPFLIATTPRCRGGRYYIPWKVKLATLNKGDPKAPFSIAITPRCSEGRYSFPWIAPLYPWSIPYNDEC